MSRVGLTREKVIERAAELANEKGIEAVTITTLAQYLGIKKPSLYNHIEGPEDLRRQIMLYGWKYISGCMVENIKEHKQNFVIMVPQNEEWAHLIEECYPDCSKRVTRYAIRKDTREDERRKHLATACSARLILECLKRGLYPSWDAQNWNSVRLSQKLGYEFSHEYPAYEVW